MTSEQVEAKMAKIHDEAHDRMMDIVDKEISKMSGFVAELDFDVNALTTDKKVGKGVLLSGSSFQEVAQHLAKIDPKLFLFSGPDFDNDESSGTALVFKVSTPKPQEESITVDKVVDQLIK